MLADQEIVQKFFNVTLHFPGVLKPWNKLIFNYNSISNIYNNSTYKEFNEFIDTNRTIIEQYQLMCLLLYEFTSSELIKENNKYDLK